MQGANMTRRYRPGFAAAAQVLGGLLLVTSLQAQQPVPGSAGDPAAARQREENNRRPDEPGTGPFAAMKEEIPALPRHVVYRPADLAGMANRKLGVVAWGNGGCSEDGASSRFHLLELASHGYLVLAAGRILSGPGAPAPDSRPAPPAGQPPSARTQASDLTDAISWALAENQRRGSPFFGRIDPAQVAVSGFSCGGLQALRVAGDPRVKAVVLHNTGVLIEGPSTVPGMDVGKEVLDDLHTPVIYILGGPADIAYRNGMDDFQKISKVPVAVANLPVGHGGTFNEPHGGSAASVAANWLDWQLRGDSSAARRFIGRDCGLCTDGRWTLQWRNQSAATGARR
jgi:dienelactone hydrolase